MVDEILRTTLRRVRDRLGGLALGADKEHASALRRGVAHGLEGLVQHRHGLGQVDDVNLVARSK